MEKIKYQFNSFSKSYDRLLEVLKMDPEENSIVLDASIQRFEFTIENAWKTIKLILKSKGRECYNPRDCISQGYKNGWIDDEKPFLELMKCRNLTSYTYKQELAWEVYETVKRDHQVFADLREALRNIIDDIEDDNE